MGVCWDLVVVYVLVSNLLDWRVCYGVELVCVLKLLRMMIGVVVVLVWWWIVCVCWSCVYGENVLRCVLKMVILCFVS